MGGAVPPLPPYAFIAWCSVRENTGATFALPLFTVVSLLQITLIIIYVTCDLMQFWCSFHELSPLTCSDSELTSETVNHFRHFGRTCWKGGGGLTHRKASIYTAQHKNADIHPCHERGSNPRSHC
jgi:hypothetical protein